MNVIASRCTNARKDPCKQSCNDYGGVDAALILWSAKQLDLIGAGSCGLAGVLFGTLGRKVRYATILKGRWYTYVDEQDLQDILQEDFGDKRCAGAFADRHWGGMQKFNQVLIAGEVGALETIYLPALGEEKGVAVINHPNPLHGGTSI